MNKGEVSTTAGNGQPAEKAAEQAKATKEQAAPVAQTQENAEQTEAQFAALAAAAASEAAEAPVAMASLEAPVKAVEIEDDADKKAEKKGEEAQDETVADLAMVPEVEIYEAIALADGARAAAGEGDAAEASLLQDGETPGFIIPALALAAVGVGIAVAVGGDDDEDDVETPTPPPPPANAAPVFTSGGTATVAENTPAGATGTVVYDANATDANNNTITFSLTGTDAAAFTINAQTGEVRFVNSPDFETKATYAFTVVANDGAGGVTNQAVALTVTNVNEAPVLAGADTVAVTFAEGTESLQVFDANATDVDANDVITYSIAGPNANLFVINPTTGVVSFREAPVVTADTTYSFSILASDSGNLTDTQTVTVTVTNTAEPNVAPVITSGDEVDFLEGTASLVVYTTVATDADGDTLTYTLEGEDAALFTISPEGVVSFITAPTVDADTDYDFTVVVSDGNGGEAEQDVTVTVTNVDLPTTVQLDTADDDGNPNTFVTIDALDGDYAFIDNPTVASRTIITGFDEGDTIAFSPTADVSFAPVGTGDDLQIIINNGGVVSEIILDGVLDGATGIVFDEATAEAAVGFDFFQPVAAVEEATIA